MTMRTLPAAGAGLLLAAGLLSACSSGTTPQAPATTQTSVVSPSAQATPTASAEATDTATAAATTAAPVAAQPSTLTLTVADGKATGRLVVKATGQGVTDAEVTLVFRPNGGGDAQVSTVKTDADGAFSSSASAAGAGTWTASFLGTKAAMASVATATVG